MRYIILVIMCLTLSCFSEDKTPTKIVKTFIEKCKQGDIEGAILLTTFADRAEWKVIKDNVREYYKLTKEQREETAIPPGFDLGYVLKTTAQFIVIEGQKVTGDKAVVYLIGKKGTKDEKKQDMNLIKEDGKWVINLGLQSEIKQEDIEMPTDSTGVPADTTAEGDTT